VRSRDEFLAGHLPGSRHAPGGQLVQATDRWVGVRGARIVVCDDTEVRAVCTAHWLKQMGWDVHVLAGGIGAAELESGSGAPDTHTASLAEVSVEAVREGIADDSIAVLDVRASGAFRGGHVPGSVWATRPVLEKSLGGEPRPVVMIADDSEVASLAAKDAAACGAPSVALMTGGFQAWVESGGAVEASPDVPADPNRIDFVAFTAGRHGGNKAHMRQYLEWEIGLVDQLDDQERGAFSIIGP